MESWHARIAGVVLVSGVAWGLSAGAGAGALAGEPRPTRATTRGEAAAGARVLVSGEVRVSQPVRVTGTGFRPGGLVRVFLRPTANRGGICCGIAAGEARADDRGRLGHEFIWPSGYFRCVVPRDCPPAPNAAWEDGEGVDVEATDARPRIVGSPPVFARAVTVVRLAPLAPAVPDPVAGERERRYQPLLRFDSSEPWRPLNIDAFFATDQPALCGDGAPCAFVGAPDELVPRRGSYLDLEGRQDDAESYRSADPACRMGGLRDCDAGPAAGLYVQTRTRGAYDYLDYWVYYRFNHAPFTKLYYGEHESDWEGLTIAVPAGRQDGPFHFASLAAHEGVWRYLRDVLRCGPTPGGCDGTSVRVNAYVANGTHASYPRPCSLWLPLVCRQTGTPWPEKGFDGRRPWGANDQPELLRALPAAEPDRWVNWEGSWSPDLRRRVASPERQARYRAPWDAQCTARWADAGALPCEVLAATGARARAS